MTNSLYQHLSHSINRLLNIGAEHGHPHSVRMTNLFALFGLPLMVVNVIAQGVGYQITAIEFWVINALVMFSYASTFLFNRWNYNRFAKAWLLIVFVADISLASTRWFGVESLMYFHLVVIYPVTFLMWQTKHSLRNAALALLSIALLGIFAYPHPPIFPSTPEQQHYAMFTVFVDCAILLSLIAFLFSSDSQRAHQELAKLASIDPLTNVLNRRELKRQIDSYEHHLLPCSVLLFDVDDFKTINDCYGHHTGDSALQFVVSQVETHLPDNAIFARFGGDEFCILLPQSNQGQAQQLATTLVTQIANSEFLAQQHKLSLSISMGVAFETKRKLLERLLIDADNAMYQAKRQGKNTYVLHWESSKSNTEI